MRKNLLVSIFLVFSIISVCNGQLIMGTPLGRQFEEYQQAQDLVSDQELQQIEEEIEDTLMKSEVVLEDLYNKNQDENLSDDEMLNALKESVRQIHDKQEEEQKKNIANDIKLATNIIGESTLDEISDELKEGYFFHPYTKNGSPQSQKQRSKSAKQKKKEIQELISKEKQWFQSTRNQFQASGENQLTQTQFTEKAAENKKKYDSFVEAQRKTLEKIEANLNKLQTKTKFEEDTTSLQDNDNQKYLQDTIDSLFENNQEQNEFEPVALNQENELQIIIEEGERLKSLKQEYDDSETLEELEKEIQDLMEVGDEMHEKFLDEQQMIQEILEKSEPVEQQEPELGVYETDDDKQLMEKEEDLENQINQVNEQNQQQNIEIIKQVEQKEKEEEQEEQSRLYKEVAFAIVIILAIIFLIFGSQVDVFSFFSHGRRAKDPFYRDDEAQQSLIN
ncbi:hypothetical protein ABPG74_002580 [Tetrahymena malaccensis]